MEREKGSMRVTKDGREGMVVETASDSMRVKVRWTDGTEEWLALADVREQASSDMPPREIGS